MLLIEILGTLFVSSRLGHNTVRETCTALVSIPIRSAPEIFNFSSRDLVKLVIYLEA